jgi:hypothetical protein
LFSGELNNGHCNALPPGGGERRQNRIRGIIGIFEEVFIL